MKNITLAVDEHVLDEVRQIAARRRTTVNALVRNYLAGIAAEEGRLAEARRGLLDLIDNSTGDMGPDWTWRREDSYERDGLRGHERPDLRRDGTDQ
jgi:hypothetical protein